MVATLRFFEVWKSVEECYINIKSMYIHKLFK